MTDGPDRRQAKRIAIRLPVVYRGPDGSPRTATTENVSRRGMLMMVQGPAPQGSRVRFAVTGADGREREVIGDVVRASADGHVAISLADDLEGVDSAG